MAKRHKSDMVGGFDVFKALERAQNESAKHKQKNSQTPKDTPEGANESPEVKQVASHIGHTIMPPKHKLVCFDCGFSFEITGNTNSILCPRCRVEISLRNEKIDGEWDGDLKTGGTVEILSDGIIKSGNIIAKEVVLCGRVDGGEVNAYHQLTIRPEGIYDSDCIATPALNIESGATLELKKKAEFKRIEVAGTLKAKKLEVSDLLFIRSGGLVSGKLSAKRMIVEDGGGLIAYADISG